MTTQIPRRLRIEPLIEAIWQVQFDPAPDQAVGDALPGVLFSALRQGHPGLMIHRLPVADIPAQVAALDPNLRFAAKYRIEAPGWSYLIQVGDRIVTLNCRPPYEGWDMFKQRISALIMILDRSGLIPEPHQHALRYIDLLTLEPPPALGSLRIGLSVGDRAIVGDPVQMRVELPDTGCRHVLQVATPALANLPDGPRQGTLIDLETTAEPTPKRWEAIQDGLEPLHTASKRLFFTQLLSQDAIERMQPEY